MAFIEILGCNKKTEQNAEQKVITKRKETTVLEYRKHSLNIGYQIKLESELKK